jgi:hypothetical protein
MAEPHDRCQNPLCTLGREHVGGCVDDLGRPFALESNDPGPCRFAPCGLAAGHEGACRGSFGQPLTMMADDEPALAELDQYLLDLQAEAREHDEAARHHQTAAKDARDRAAHLRAWRAKNPPAPPAVGSGQRSPNP